MKGNKIYKLTDKEIEKWLKIIGPRLLKNLFVESKIQLTDSQKDRIIDYEKEQEENIKKGKK